MKAVAYFRVSTAGQGRSGLGLEAQRSAVSDMAAQRSLEVLAEFTEVESGKRNDRPELAKALHYAKVTGAVLVIAKLDRLSRNAAFLLRLRDSGAKFLAADIPDANDVTIGVLAVIAQAEREAISQRTKEALAAIKQRIESGTGHVSRRSGRVVESLGNPGGSQALKRAGKGNTSAIRALKRASERRADDLEGIIQEILAGGVSTVSGLANAMNGRRILTARNRRWHVSTVRGLLARLGVDLGVGAGHTEPREV